jgi:hypothetical protein
VLTEIDYGVFQFVVSLDAGPFAGPVSGSCPITLRR